jgi:hypothetical protein
VRNGSNMDDVLRKGAGKSRMNRHFGCEKRVNKSFDSRADPVVGEFVNMVALAKGSCESVRTMRTSAGCREWIWREDGQACDNATTLLNLASGEQSGRFGTVRIVLNTALWWPSSEPVLTTEMGPPPGWKRVSEGGWVR